MRLDWTRYAIIQFSRILMFSVVSCKRLPIRNEWDEVKKLANLQRFLNISCSGMHSPSNAIQTLKCRHKFCVFELFSYNVYFLNGKDLKIFYTFNSTLCYAPLLRSCGQLTCTYLISFCRTEWCGTDINGQTN